MGETPSKESDARYRGLLEAAPDAMVVIDGAGEIVLLNVQAENQFGYLPDELVGQQVTTIIPEGFAERLIADGTRSSDEALAQQIGTGIELSGLRKDGSEFPIEIMLSPLENADGILVTAAIRDITVRKAAEARLAQVKGEQRDSVEALRQSEERYRMLLDGVRDYAIFMIDPDGRIVSWNAGAQRIKGYTADEIIGRNFSCFFLQDEIAQGRPQEVLRIAAATGQHQEQGLRVRKDGSQFLANVTFTALHDAAGDLLGFSEFSHDLSEGAKSEARYRGLLEAAPDAMVVVDDDGDIVIVNVQAELQFGYRRDELIGQKFTTIIPHGFAERLAADAERSEKDALEQYIGAGPELVAVRKDGSTFPIEIMLSPLTSADGTLVTAAIRGVAARKAAEQLVIRMEAQYRGLLDAVPDPLVVVNEAQEIVLMNIQIEEQFGYCRGELLGQKVTTIIPHGFAERLVSDALRPDDLQVRDFGAGEALSGRHKDGRVFPIEIMLSTLAGPDGDLVTAVIRDISARRKAEQFLEDKMVELNRSNKELEQFADIASHDLQEPLRMVASYTQLLARRYNGKLDSDADEFIAFAVDGANRMQRLIQDLLAYSRVGTKGGDLVETDSNQALTYALRNLGGAIEDNGAVVTHDTLPSVLADEGQLIQLFQNLIANAIKYQSSETPRVHVSVDRHHGDRWQFSVRDNGLGIEEKYFDRIFGMFERLHRREEYSGTGIGLAICRKIVERHNGSISVASQPGQGSTFSFALKGSHAS